MSDNIVITHLTDAHRFGSQTRLALAAGVKPHTINGKRKSENPLTHSQMRRILKTAPEMGVAIDPWDFFPDLRPGDLQSAA
jgi:uncharacterized protein (DUF2384 family)